MEIYSTRDFSETKQYRSGSTSGGNILRETSSNFEAKTKYLICVGPRSVLLCWSTQRLIVNDLLVTSVLIYVASDKDDLLVTSVDFLKLHVESVPDRIH